MADRDIWRKNVPKDFDGRFGDRFDGEIRFRGVIEVTVGILIACALGMGITWYMLGRNDAKVEASAPAPSPIDQANEQRLPVGPLLQARPEAELETMRHEMATRLHGWGWVCEGAVTVHIPIAKAIDLVVAERGGHGSDEMQAEESEDAADEGVAIEPGENALAVDHGAGEATGHGGGGHR